MSILLAIQPVYQCEVGRCDENPKNWSAESNNLSTYTQIAAYLVLAALFYNQFIVLPRRKQGDRDYLDQRPHEVDSLMSSDIVMNPVSKTDEDPEKGNTKRIVKMKDPRTINKNLFDYSANEEEVKEFTRNPADVLARAFADDYMIRTWPGVGLGVDDRQVRVDASKDLFSGYLRMMMRFHHCFEIDGGRAYMFAVYSPSGADCDTILGVESMMRNKFRSPSPSLETAQIYQMTRRSLSQGWNGSHRPHIYLHTLGVDPEHQGKGLGGIALKYLCDIADKRQVPIALNTAAEKNIQIYKKYGFTVADRIANSPWVGMLREAMPPE